MEKIRSEITYTMQGDYLLPDLALPEQENFFFGRYGRLHGNYLKKRKNGIYAGLLLSCRLSTYLAEVEKQAKDMLQLLMKQIAENEDITEQLKAIDQMAWVGAMNNIKARAEEVVLNEIVYA